MPITKSAIKKQRADKKRTLRNLPITGRVKSALKKVRVDLNPKAMKELQSAMDRAVKKSLIPKHRAARLKSRVAKKIKLAK